jgi:hypothetical protein
MARAEPDRAALEFARHLMGAKDSVDTMLKDPALKAALTAAARRHMRRRGQFDPKKLQANDND